MRTIYRPWAAARSDPGAAVQAIGILSSGVAAATGTLLGDATGRLIRRWQLRGALGRSRRLVEFSFDKDGLGILRRDVDERRRPVCGSAVGCVVGWRWCTSRSAARRRGGELTEGFEPHQALRRLRCALGFPARMVADVLGVTGCRCTWGFCGASAGSEPVAAVDGLPSRGRLASNPSRRPQRLPATGSRTMGAWTAGRCC